MEQYAEIIDKGECMSTLYQFPTFPWPAPFLKSVACKEEWAKHDFYPSNGLVGEIVYNLESQIYILKVNNTFYVPMSKKGIQVISESEYNNKKATHEIQGMDDRQKRINNEWSNLTSSAIGEANILMLRDFNLHNYNQHWIIQNTSQPVSGNKYNNLREEAPFYCNSSMGVMLNFFKNDNGFKNRILQLVNQFKFDSIVSNKNLNELAKWVIIQTLISIKQEESDKFDLQNVGWWMGISTYVACIISENYYAQYENIFILAWSKYFMNETLI